MLSFLAAAAAACGGGTPADPGPVPTNDPPAAPTVAPLVADPTCVCGNEPGCSPCPPSASSPPPPAASAPVKPAQFPPAAIPPPVERTKADGDGVWSPIAVHKASGEASPVYRTVIHPHKIRPFVIVEIVAIDLSRLDMQLVGGTAEPEGSDVPVDKRPGLVPPAELDRLVAGTNGGFKKRHGGHGITVPGAELVPAKPELCTFAKTTGGGFRLGTWSTLAPQAGELSWLRQTAPCLIEDGTKNADLASEYRAKKWGGAEDGNKEIRRSAIGVGADPGVLYFAIADYATAEWLADGLLAAGITTAAQLDINYSYTRFIVYERGPSGELRATSPLLKDLKAPRNEYWKEPTERDFFYLRWR